MTVTHPLTGQPMQQAIHTITDPNTGEISQIMINPNSSNLKDLGEPKETQPMN